MGGGAGKPLFSLCVHKEMVYFLFIFVEIKGKKVGTERKHERQKSNLVV